MSELENEIAQEELNEQTAGCTIIFKNIDGREVKLFVKTEDDQIEARLDFGKEGLNGHQALHGALAMEFMNYLRGA